MFDFLSRWYTRPESDQESLPFPVTEKSKSGMQHDAAISPPIPHSFPQSITGFDDHAGLWQYPLPPSQPQPQPQSSPSRAGPSNVAWLRSSGPRVMDEETPIPVLMLTPPPPVRVQTHVHPMGRSVSLPPISPNYNVSPESPSSSSVMAPRGSLKLHTNQTFSQSTHSLRLDPRPHSTDLFGYALQYPLAKQLSPIPEQDYFSPDSLRRSKPLPALSDHDVSTSTTHTNPSPSGSQISEITRPSPIYSHPFITRQLNRTISQTSSRTHVSTTSSLQKASPPSIPPLDLRPPFPGPHPSHGGHGPPPRTHRSTLPTIIGSSESEPYGDDDFDPYDDDAASQHADSFVTASDAILADHHGAHGSDMDANSEQIHYSLREGSSLRLAPLPSIHSSSQSMHPSTSESIGSRRWDRDGAPGNGAVTFKAKRSWVLSTPAFWAFWLGFICPLLWIIGGWHFTHFGEQPPRLTFWEFYFNAGYWKEKFGGGKNKRLPRRKGKADAPLPRWVAEKQNSDDGRARLNDPKRSLRGISFGYPFISRPVHISGVENWSTTLFKGVFGIIAAPNRLFDQLYGIKLREVRGRPESRRRMFDPWIQRCRYALCYSLILLLVGLCIACAYLIIHNTP